VIVTTGGVGERHLAVCRRFGESVRAADGKWDHRSPCDEWDARAVLEHVIGFHDVLLLRPMGLKPDRPRDDPQRRWQLTYRQLEKAFESGIGPDAAATLPNITRDVLMHTFASGVHACIGAALARIEGATALRALFETFPDLRLVEPIQRGGLVNLHGFTRLPAQLGSRRATPADLSA
jgi:hypothetical protein